ncbi:serine hydrolase [Pleurocapsales cyanobacterium LEGE 10410]|nr:serine hydrolase [Pleurocapsales cyanobacterium LEGE 10410]
MLIYGCFPRSYRVNRSGKHSPTRVKNTKAKPKRKVAARKSRRLFNFTSKNPASTKKIAKSDRQQLDIQGTAEHNLRPTNDRDLANLNSQSNYQSKQRKRQRSSLWLAIHLVTITVGLSTILGTVVSLANSLETFATPDSTPVTVPADSSNQVKLDSLFAISSLGNEITALKDDLQQLANQYPDLEPEIFLVDLDNKGFVSIGAEKAIASASTIKLPILVAFFQELDRGTISLEEQLTMTQDAIAEGSGNMRYEEPGAKFSVLETATRMMTISDNTATNMIIDRLGGIEKLNDSFIKMGLQATRLNNPLPDLTGTNTTSSEDLGNLLVKIDSGQLISLRSRDRLLHIMRNTARNTLLPEGLGSEAIIAHKTGDIKSVLGDTGIIDMPNGKRYIASMLVKRPDNSPQAKEFIQEASSIAYQYFAKPQGSSFTLDEEQE